MPWWFDGTDERVPASLPVTIGQVPVVTALPAPAIQAFRERYPEFASAPDQFVTSILTEATGEVNSAWNLADQQPAMLAFAAHLLALQGFGGDSVSIGGQSFGVQGPLKEYKAGDTSLSFDQAVRPRLTLTDAAADLSFTPYGRRFLALQRRNALGVLVV